MSDRGALLSDAIEKRLSAGERGIILGAAVLVLSLIVAIWIRGILQGQF